MWKGWRNWGSNKKQNEISTSDEELDSDFENDEDDEEGPTLVTIDDGKGGIKHIKVQKAVDSQSEIVQNPCDEMSNDGTHIHKLSSAGSETPKIGLGDLVKRELKGKHFLNIEPHAEKLRKRIISKRGHVNIGKTRVSKRRRRFLSDFFNTMLDIKWRYVHFFFFMAFIGSWFAFACVWYIIIYYHGDLEEEHLPKNQEKSGWTPCVWQIENFASVFLFSVETQHTIGYGGRQTTEECPEAIFIMSFQSIVGVMIQACMVGIIFSKLSRPKKRASTLMFSKNAVVCQRDGTNCLLFRVGNMRHSTLVEAHVRAILISKRVTEEGEIMPYFQTELSVGTDSEGEEDEIFFIWPTTLVHKINSDSPFYNMSAKDFLKKRYEIVVILEGVIEQTGNSIQARSSYLPNEVLWGYRFVNLLTFKHSASEYKIDYSAFNAVYKADLSPKSQKTKDLECEEVDATADDEEDRKQSIASSSSPNHIDTLRTMPKRNYLHSNSCLPNYVPESYLKNTPSIYPVVPPATPTSPSVSKFTLEDDKSDFHKAKSCVEILHMV